MENISEELKTAISQIKPAMVATASKSGQPNVSPKGSLRVLDDQHLVFADLRSPQTIENLKENPYLSIIALDPATRKGWRVWGKTEEIMTSGTLFDQLSNDYASKGKVNHVVKILVEKGLVM
jgi:predicted pyridoxine 5'-phosphate oxidase superfamily flavin-nucleotide-binding protein